MPVKAVEAVCCKTALSKTGIPGYRFCLNPYTGCVHACRYCYADTVLRFAGHAAEWGEFVRAKVNFPEVLRRELRRKKSLAGRVILGTVTDAYQPAEAVYNLTRSALEVLLAEWPEVEIDLLTKSDLVVRDLDLFKSLKGSSVGFTVTTADDGAAAVLEPGAAPPSARLRAARRLIEGGISVWAFVAPVLPGITDAPGALEGLLNALRGAGIREIYFDPLNPYPAAVRRLKVAYRRAFRRALGRLEDYLRDPQSYMRLFSRRLAALSPEGDSGMRLP
ncbi:SPL family radical SAM protein [Desulfovirgula thermocuniculi]|uniref:SPL family radical SAM protein n=1 Tax=Desulfovirgula thermocuniculi TaxID=348842 RepID=UPI00041A5C5F|nr:radical SAM protein [Desulfovirgula thermocuniculi]